MEIIPTTHSTLLYVTLIFVGFDFPVVNCNENDFDFNDRGTADDDGSKTTNEIFISKQLHHGNRFKYACGNVTDALKFDCYPEDGVDEQKCNERRCCWSPKSSGSSLPPLKIPYCYYPSDHQGYSYVNVTRTEDGYRAFLKRPKSKASPYPGDVWTLRMDVTFETTTRLRIKFYDPQSSRYEVPVPKLKKSKPSGRSDSNLYQITFRRPAGFKVVRRLDRLVLFDTDVGSLIFADQFIQISTRLPSSNLYGLGEHQDGLRRDLNWNRFTFFAADQPPESHRSLYGSHPFYLAMEPENGRSHGVLLFNSNAMEVILQPAPALTFRPLGGILDFYFFLGPSPTEVVSQYTELIGRPFMPPYWSLGFHLCRFGYKTLNNTRKVWLRNRRYEIPFDTQWNDMDFADENKMFTYDRINYAGLPQFIEEVHRVGMKYMTNNDPAISAEQPPGTYPPYDDGLAHGIFVKDISGQFLRGRVWTKGSCVFIDFTNPKATVYWTKQFQRFHKVISFDGAWIDMNEPCNFVNGSIRGCPKNSSLEYPPYVPQMDHGAMAGKTLCMTALQHSSVHYNVHNLYGITETISTYESLRHTLNKRPFIISRSTFPGQGHYGGHWTGDISSTWTQMSRSIATVLNFNMFGIPMVGADICGFSGNTTAKLCQRWMQLGAFYPFSRNHNDVKPIDQDPAAFGPKVAHSSREALLIRYTLLPYIYTRFYEAHTAGLTVARPLFFEFPSDKITYGMDRQFLLGPAVHVIPVLTEDAVRVRAYFPSGIWYDYHTFIALRTSGSFHDLDAPLDRINVYLRGGHVIPTQKPETTTTVARRNNFTILACFDEHGNSSGHLYWDDGDSLDTVGSGRYSSIEFVSSRSGWFRSNPVHGGYKTEARIENVVFLGAKTKPSGEVKANGRSVKFRYDRRAGFLAVYGLNLSLTDKNSITWN